LKALIFAAGRGKRMRPLSDVTPKPLLKVWGRPMIEWQILSMKAAGIEDFVINTAHLSDQFPKVLGDGSRLGVRIQYSVEGTKDSDALETLGGIVNALPLLIEEGSEQTPFLVASGDIVTEFDYRSLVQRAENLKQSDLLAYLVLVDNPSFHPDGDMGLIDGMIVRLPKMFTYANIGLFSPQMFSGLKVEYCSLFPWLFQWADKRKISGEFSSVSWFNVGTPEELEKVNGSPKPLWAEKLDV